jgi:hypothetical protein
MAAAFRAAPHRPASRSLTPPQEHLADVEAVAVCYGWLLRVTRTSDAAHRLIEDGYSAKFTADQEHFGASHKPAFGLKRPNVPVRVATSRG